MLPNPQDRRVGRCKESDLKNPLGNPQREELRQELERIAFGEATSGRRALAKVTALRSLERLSRPAEPAAEQVDDDGRWHPGPPEFWSLDRHHSDVQRECWRRNWEAANRGRR